VASVLSSPSGLSLFVNMWRFGNCLRATYGYGYSPRLTREKNMRRNVIASLGCGLALLVAAAALVGLPPALGQQPAAAPPSADARLPSSGQPAGKQAQRAREGSLLTDEAGSFEFVGDRIVFVPTGSRESLRVLENLALERIVRELGDARDQRNWSVWGVLTEFKGANYLLVTKSLLQTPATPTATRSGRAVPVPAAEGASGTPGGGRPAARLRQPREVRGEVAKPLPLR